VSLRFCLRQTCSYGRLLSAVEALRTTAYDCEDEGHEAMLMDLWRLLQPGIPLSQRRTKEWQNVGFQGEDPKTDFRGMGVLGLHNLL